MSKITSFLSLFFFSVSLLAQTQFLQGNLTSETTTARFENRIFICHKEYSGLDKKASKKVRKNGMMTYMDLPLDAKNVSVGGDLFESRLACFEDGKMKWTKVLGQTSTSSRPAMTQGADGTIYTGEKVAERRAIIFYKYDLTGKEIWQITFDSLETIHEIFVDDSKYLTALVSFTSQEKVEGKKSFHVKTTVAYHTLQIDKNTGKRISKRYNNGPTHFCRQGFSQPILDTRDVNYFHKSDTLVYSRNDTVHMLTVSQEELAGHKIFDVTSGENEYYVVAKSNKSRSHKLLVNRWAESASLKKEVSLPINSSAKILEILKRQKGGVFIVHQSIGAISVTLYTQELEFIETQILVNKENMKGFAFSEAFADDKDQVSIVLAKQEGKTRTLHIMPQ